jgi:hypothetical protein
MDQQPHERNEKDDYRALSNTEFSFKYTESGGITNRYLLISYNSKTNIVRHLLFSYSNYFEQNALL